MSIDIGELEDEELGLINALDSMVFQYGPHAAQDDMSALEQKSFIALSQYRLYCFEDGIFVIGEEAFSQVGDLMAAWYDRNYKRNPSQMSHMDFDRLNDRSLHMLALLAGWCDEALSYPDDGGIYHDSMSAGEHAMWQLETFKLIQLEASLGRWTGRGRNMLRNCSSLGAFPA